VLSIAVLVEAKDRLARRKVTVLAEEKKFEMEGIMNMHEIVPELSDDYM